MSHWVVKVGIDETHGAEPSRQAHAAMVERVEKLQLEVASVLSIGPRVLVIEPKPIVDVEGLAERIAAWPGVSYARAVLREDVEAAPETPTRGV